MAHFKLRNVTILQLIHLSFYDFVIALAILLVLGVSDVQQVSGAGVPKSAGGIA
jgi:hypothetical protein